MIFGIDFDNTIVSYDRLFHKLAVEQNLIPASVPVNKSDVRNQLRAQGMEEEWIVLQGVGYGSRMAEADIFPGVKDFFRSAVQQKIPIQIISHKTKHPFRGEQIDLHATARNWLEINGFFDPKDIGLSRDAVFFELTKKEKCQRIGKQGCTHFLDDLPEFLAEPDFPSTTQRFLFDPNNLYTEEKRFQRVQSWNEFLEFTIQQASKA